MDEKQLQELENKKNIPAEKECGFVCQHEEEIKEGVRWAEWTVSGLAIGFISIIVGFYLWNLYLVRDREIEDIRSQIEAVGGRSDKKQKNESKFKLELGNLDKKIVKFVRNL